MAVLVERFQNIRDVSQVFVERTAKDNDIVEVNQTVVGSRSTNNVVHASFERRRCVFQPRGQNIPFE